MYFVLGYFEDNPSKEVAMEVGNRTPVERADSKGDQVTRLQRILAGILFMSLGVAFFAYLVTWVLVVNPSLHGIQWWGVVLKKLLASPDSLGTYLCVAIIGTGFWLCLPTKASTRN